MQLMSGDRVLALMQNITKVWIPGGLPEVICYNLWQRLILAMILLSLSCCLSFLLLRSFHLPLFTICFILPFPILKPCTLLISHFLSALFCCLAWCHLCTNSSVPLPLAPGSHFQISRQCCGASLGNSPLQTEAGRGAKLTSLQGRL